MTVQPIQLKRSAVPSKVPTTSDIQLGELAMNTYDGKVFLHKNDGSDSIVEVGAQTISGDATGSGNGAIALTLANSGVTAGAYGSASVIPTVTVDAKGRVTAVSTQSVGTASQANSLSTARNISTSGDATWTVSFDGSANATAALTLANSGATAGTYNNVTIDAKGRVTAGTNTSYLTANQTITASGDATGSGTTSLALTLANSGVTAGTYTSVTVDAKGRVTAGTNPGGSGSAWSALTGPTSSNTATATVANTLQQLQMHIDNTVATCSALFQFTEDTASTAATNKRTRLVEFRTLSGSTAYPFLALSQAAANANPASGPYGTAGTGAGLGSFYMTGGGSLTASVAAINLATYLVTSGSSGGINIGTGSTNGSATSGSIGITTGQDINGGNTGSIIIASGPVSTGYSGYVRLYSGTTNNGITIDPQNGATTFKSILGLDHYCDTMNFNTFAGGAGIKFIPSVNTSVGGLDLSMRNGGGFIRKSTSETNNANPSGSTQTGATLIIYQAIVATGGSGGGYLLQDANGAEFIVINKSGGAINVYPPVGGRIDSLGTNNPYSVPDNGKVMFICIDSLVYYTFASA